MQYDVQAVDQDELPVGLDLVIVERGGGQPPVMLLSGRPAEAWLAMRTYESVFKCAGEPSMLRAV